MNRRQDEDKCKLGAALIRVNEAIRDVGRACLATREGLLLIRALDRLNTFLLNLRRKAPK